MVRELFSDEDLQKTAGKCGFYKKKSDFMPAMFFDMLLYCASQTEACSLEQASNMVFATYGLKISKQSIDERFSKHTVVFVKEILKEALEKQLSKVFDPRFLPKFNRICIKDGTRFNLPERLNEYYKGSGGSKGTSNAAVCIQFEYDARSGKILSLEITNGTRNDQTDAKETATRVDLGDLILRDLGYYSLPTLSKFDNSSAFFISRLGSKTNVYDSEKLDEISFKKLYADMLKMRITSTEKNIHAGKKERFPLRLIIQIVSDDVYQQRIRKIEKENKSKGYNTSDDYKARCRFNLFITNVKQDFLSIEEVLHLYKLRWQIELMFKNWKSICKIDEIQPMKYERFTCLLHAKLILIVVDLQIIWNLKRYYYANTRKILSMFKCFNTLQRNFETLNRILKKKRKESERCLLKIIKMFSVNHWKEKRKGRTNYEDILDLFLCQSNKYEYIYARQKRSGTPICHPEIIKKPKFIDMTKEIKSSPVSKRNGVKNELYTYNVDL
jgi:hypothetical protein